MVSLTSCEKKHARARANKDTLPSSFHARFPFRSTVNDEQQVPVLGYTSYGKNESRK